MTRLHRMYQVECTKEKDPRVSKQYIKSCQDQVKVIAADTETTLYFLLGVETKQSSSCSVNPFLLRLYWEQVSYLLTQANPRFNLPFLEIGWKQISATISTQLSRLGTTGDQVGFLRDAGTLPTNTISIPGTLPSSMSITPTAASLGSCVVTGTLAPLRST